MSRKKIIEWIVEYFAGEIKNIITTVSIGASIGFMIFYFLSEDIGKVEKKITTNNNVSSYIVVFDDDFKEKEVIYKTIESGALYFITHIPNADIKTLEGIKLNESQKAWVKAFYSAVVECSKSKKVSIKIKGHASTAEFMKNGKKLSINESERLNKLAANLSYRSQP